MVFASFIRHIIVVFVSTILWFGQCHTHTHTTVPSKCTICEQISIWWNILGVANWNGFSCSWKHDDFVDLLDLYQYLFTQCIPSLDIACYKRWRHTFPSTSTFAPAIFIEIRPIFIDSFILMGVFFFYPCIRNPSVAFMDCAYFRWCGPYWCILICSYLPFRKIG